MLDAQEITHRFLDTKLQVHPEVVRYILEQDEPELIDLIIAAVPKRRQLNLHRVDAVQQIVAKMPAVK